MPPFLTPQVVPSGKQVIEQRSGEYLNVSGSFFAKDHFYVWRSPPANTTWSGYGGALGHNPASGDNQRNSNYITQNGQTYFHSNQYPLGVSKNGLPLSGNFDLAPINQYHVVRLTMNDNNVGPYSSYQIGRLTGLQCNLDIAEIIAFESKLSDDEADKIESYLAHKWGLANQLTAGHAYKDRVAIRSPRDLGVSTDLTGLVKGNTYYYRVKAENTEGTDWADSTASFVSESIIDMSSGDLTFYTDPPVAWTASDGSGGNGVLETLSWTDSQSNTVQHKVAKFSFSQINIGDGVKVSLVGSNPIHLDVENNATILAKLDASGTQGSNFSVLGGGLGGGLGTTNLTFSTGQSNNHDLSNTYGSNISSSSSGATVVYGGTPDISLAWTAAANVLEVHGSTNQYWNHIDSSTSVDVLQLDLNGGEADPYITFSVGVGKALSLESVLIGHSTAQTISDYPWTLTITKVGGSQVFSHTTAAMGAGDKEQVDFNFKGEFGASYILKFSDNGISDASAAIDNLKFSQIYGTGGFHGSGPSHIVGANPYNSGGSRYKGGSLSGSGLVAGEAPGGGSYGGKGGRPELNGGTDSLGAHPISGQTYGNINVDALLAGSGGGAGSSRFWRHRGGCHQNYCRWKADYWKGYLCQRRHGKFRLHQ